MMQRPIDAELINELFWQLFEVGNGTRQHLDLTEWGTSGSFDSSLVRG